MTTRSVTAGEKLFVLIRDKIVSRELAMPKMQDVLQNVSGSPGFPAYIWGAITVHAVRRLMRYSNDEKSNVSEDLYGKKIYRFVTGEMFPGLDRDLTGQITRAVMQAENASSRPIPPSVKKDVLQRGGALRCYLCSRPLDPAVKRDSPDFLTLEHLWPSSIGGDSIEENLLPACKKCQIDKADGLSWEWFNVHNLMLPSSPDEEALKAVPWSARIARHYHRVMQECESEGWSLKVGFERIGTVKHGTEHVRGQSGHPVTFFNI
ncbi:MAG: hypothetical protein U0359_26515 [Byssovorax sp.]